MSFSIASQSHHATYYIICTLIMHNSQPRHKTSAEFPKLCYFQNHFPSRCNVDVIKKFRQMYKRVGAVIMDYSSEPGTKSSLETSEMKHFMRIPVFGTIFPPRSRPKVNEDDEAATTTTRRRSFGDLLDNFVSEELLRPSQGACFVCDSPTKV